MVRHADPGRSRQHTQTRTSCGRASRLSRGDPGALGQLYAEDVRCHYPGRSPLASDYQGTAQLLKLAGRLAELSGGSIRLELHDVLANGEHAVALFAARAERAGKQLQDNTVQVLHIRDGKVTEVWFHRTDLYAVDEFLS